MLCHDFSSKTFCLTVQKHFVEEPFCAVFKKISDSGKVFGLEVVGSIKILSKQILPHSAENVGEPFSLSSISGIEKV